MIGSEIIDTTIAAEKPVTARLMRALRNNVAGLNHDQLEGFISGGQVMATVFTTIVTYPLFIAEPRIGAGGVKLTVYGVTLRTINDGSLPRTSHYRLKIGSDTSAQYNHLGTGTESIDMEITFDPTASVVSSPTRGAWVDVEFQGYCDDPDDLAECSGGTLVLIETVQ